MPINLPEDQPGFEGKPSKVEILKASSAGLAGQLAEELADESTDHVSEDSYQLLKFHGSYQQDDRDLRQPRKKQGLDRAWSFMVRTKFPGGRLTAEQYLVADELTSRYANNTLRITTRQDFQFHGVGKANLKPLIRNLNERWITTYGGCGDIARNTLTCPVADLLPGNHFDYQALAKQVSDHFLADSTAYYELWLDGSASWPMDAGSKCNRHARNPSTALHICRASIRSQLACRTLTVSISLPTIWP